MPSTIDFNVPLSARRPNSFPPKKPLSAIRKSSHLFPVHRNAHKGHTLPHTRAPTHLVPIYNIRSLSPSSLYFLFTMSTPPPPPSSSPPSASSSSPAGGTHPYYGPPPSRPLFPTPPSNYFTAPPPYQYQYPFPLYPLPPPYPPHYSFYYPPPPPTAPVAAPRASPRRGSPSQRRRTRVTNTSGSPGSPGSSSSSSTTTGANSLSAAVSELERHARRSASADCVTLALLLTSWINSLEEEEGRFKKVFGQSRALAIVVGGVGEGVTGETREMLVGLVERVCVGGRRVAEVVCEAPGGEEERVVKVVGVLREFREMVSLVETEIGKGEGKGFEGIVEEWRRKVARVAGLLGGVREVERGGERVEELEGGGWEGRVREVVGEWVSGEVLRRREEVKKKWKQVGDMEEVRREVKKESEMWRKEGVGKGKGEGVWEWMEEVGKWLGEMKVAMGVMRKEGGLERLMDMEEGIEECFEEMMRVLEDDGDGRKGRVRFSEGGMGGSEVMGSGRRSRHVRMKSSPDALLHLEVDVDDESERGDVEDESGDVEEEEVKMSTVNNNNNNNDKHNNNSNHHNNNNNINNGTSNGNTNNSSNRISGGAHGRSMSVDGIPF